MIELRYKICVTSLKYYIYFDCDELTLQDICKYIPKEADGSIRRDKNKIVFRHGWEEKSDELFLVPLSEKYKLVEDNSIHKIPIEIFEISEVHKDGDYYYFRLTPDYDPFYDQCIPSEILKGSIKFYESSETYFETDSQNFKNKKELVDFLIELSTDNIQFRKKMI